MGTGDDSGDKPDLESTEVIPRDDGARKGKAAPKDAAAAKDDAPKDDAPKGDAAKGGASAGDAPDDGAAPKDAAKAKARAKARQEAIERVLEDEGREGRRDAGRRARDDEDRAARRPAGGRLADALGIETGDRPPSKWRRRFIYLLVLGAIALVTWILSVRNHGHFYLVCFPDRIEPERGSQWPWGREAIAGEAYAAVKVPPEVDCRERAFESQEALDQALADLLIARIEADVRAGTPKLDEVAVRVTQAQLLTRGRPEARARLQQLGADLSYLRGRQGVEQAAATLKGAIGHFRDAKTRRAAVGQDAEQWIEHLERLLPLLASPRVAPPAPASAPTQVPLRPAPATPATPAAPAAPGRDAGVAVPPPGGVLL